MSEKIYSLRRRLGLLSFVCAQLFSQSVAARPTGGLSVGTITTKQDCQYFLESEGVHTQIATPWLYASSMQWRTWWVKDCVAQFATMRSSLEAALASSGALPSGPGNYRVNVTIEGVSGGDPVSAPQPSGARGYSFARSSIFTSYSVSVTDGSGHVVFGHLGKKAVEVGSEIIADGTRSQTSMTGEAVYGVLQNELALTIARAVSFHFAPLKVTEVQNDRIALNYGAPFLTVGATLRVPVGNGLSTLQFVVISAGGGRAIAELDGDFDTTAIALGTTVTYIEADDPAANGRRYDRIRLP